MCGFGKFRILNGTDSLRIKLISVYLHDFLEIPMGGVLIKTTRYGWTAL